MIERICKGDLVARERRNLLSASERASLPHHLASCASCRLARQIGTDFDSIGALRPGDDARIARIASALSVATTPGRRIATRARATAVLIAAAICLVAAGALGARFWTRRTSEIHLATAALERPRDAVPATVSAPLVSVEPPVSVEQASVPTLPDPPPSDLRATVAASPGRAPAPATDDASATAIFANANQARHDGAPERAITLYRRLEQKFPTSPEAHLSCVSLGRLLLERGLAAPALGRFDRYLSVAGGQLAAEALAGRARALEMLDRQREELDTWNRLLREFPGSVYATRARQRLAELE
jgi:hypothetical protein